MTPDILFVDFDETLFNHMAYLSWVEDFLEHYGVEKGSFVREIDQFHADLGGNMRLYDHQGHMQKISSRSWSFISGEIEKKLARSPNDCCYEDAHAFIKKAIINNDVRILTFGNGDYQRFKIKTCTLLSTLNVPIHVVDEPKSIFLNREYGSSQGILIDDKYPLNLPKGWRHIWIARNDLRAKPQALVDGAIKISSLAQYQTALGLM